MLDLKKKKALSNELLAVIISAIIVGGLSLIIYFKGIKWFGITIIILIAFIIIWGLTCMTLEFFRG